MRALEPQEAQRVARALFKESRSADDTQVTEFSFASACLELGGGDSLEVGIDAEPAYSKSHGLHFSMTLRASLCQEDSCQELFSKKLSAELSSKLCSSKNPISEAFATHPKLMQTAMSQALAFEKLVLGTSRALAEAKAIGKSAQATSKGAKPPRI